MKKVAVGEALGAGFRIIQARPLAPLVWGLVYVACAAIPSMIALAIMAPNMALMTANPNADPSAALAMMAPMQLANLVQMVLSVGGMGIINAAVCRAVLEPDNSRAFYLRLGAQELWQALVMAVLYILIAATLFAVLLPFGIGGIVAGVMAGRNGAGIAGAVITVVIGGLLAFVAVGYIWVRLSLALPMSFAHRQFRLFESWNLTKGNAGRLFGLGVSVFFIIMAAEIVFGVLVAALGFGLFAMNGGTGALQELMAAGPSVWMPKLAIWGIPVMLVFGALVGYLQAFALAPWAEAYRQLVGPNYAEVFSDGPSPVLA